ncbi:MAG TPA: tetratricopeptide repeat protein [Burkholderiales bacterium]|nr:tetratricopeptide repeat protein [Burkholderiales bacterium]
MTAAASWLKRLFAGEPSLDELMHLAREREQAGDLVAARENFQAILDREPRHVAALVGLGKLHDREGRHADAAGCFRAALSAEPDNGDAYHCLGVTLSNADRHGEAEETFRQGLGIEPDAVHLLVGRAAALIRLGRTQDARASLERALRVAPSHAEAYFGLAHVCLEEARVEEAVAALRRAHELVPMDVASHSGLLYAMNYSDRYGREALFAEHRRFGALQAQAVPAPRPDPAWPRRLRVGYISPDLRSHVVAAFMLPVLKRHDRDRFQIFCYYLYPRSDSVTDVLRELSDHWRHCAALEYPEIADWVRRDRIDVLVDLAGHTADNALGVLALRPAPVQGTYLGYPNTTGLASVDFRITDAKADPPPAADRLHTERLVRLPRTFLCYRPGPRIEVSAPPAANGAGVTFGCFNNALKLSDSFFRAAARVLREVPRSRLLLKVKQGAVAATRERGAAALVAAGVDPSRLAFHDWEAEVQDHLAAYSAMDIALDSFPYNGTTTTCEALTMGVPVVTLAGDRHASRVGASLLESVGLPELIAQTEDQFVAVAAGLATDLSRLASIRAQMRERLQGSPLRDEAAFVRDLEQAYVSVWEEKLREPDQDDVALEAAWNRFHDEGDPGAAIVRIGTAIGRRGETAACRYMLGCAYEDATRWSEAAESYRRALELDPRHARAANNLGALLQLSGHAQDAEKRYDQAVSSDPRLAIARANRGKLRLAQGRLAEAEADLRTALELDPGQPDWRERLEECRSRLRSERSSA